MGYCAESETGVLAGCRTACPTCETSGGIRGRPVGLVVVRKKTRQKSRGMCMAYESMILSSTVRLCPAGSQTSDGEPPPTVRSPSISTARSGVIIAIEQRIQKLGLETFKQ